MAVYDGDQRTGEAGEAIEGVALARFDERSDGTPIFRSHVVPGERLEGPFQAVVVNLDTIASQEEAKTIPLFEL